LINSEFPGTMSLKVEIDPDSGFCAGVQRAIRLAEKELKISGILYCLGEIVHNHPELDRMKAMGLKVIDYNEFRKLHNVKVLIRAHGEPPEIFAIARENQIEIMNATCPIVSRLQEKIRTDYKECRLKGGNIFIYGKQNHPEVRALLGQTDGKAKVIRNLSEINDAWLNEPVYLYSQTTMNQQGYEELISGISEKVHNAGNDPGKILKVNDTICRYVSHRQSGIEEFARYHEIILFVSSKESSNGRILFEHCKSINPASFFITDIQDIKNIPLDNTSSIGICGATSTPGWLLEKIRLAVNEQLGVGI
jgi:4-hydroxy-3-methylbut-2-enyl diphosphate reductase